jgi:hypothetical protein
MNIKEAAEKCPSLRCILDKLPEESVVGYDPAFKMWHFSFGIVAQESISDFTIKECNSDMFPYIADKWYRDMHQKLIESEVRYKIKMGKSNELSQLW